MNITFFFPYPYISGIPVLFSNVANYLLSTTDIKVNIIDYKDGALIRSCIKHDNLNFIEFKDFEPCNLDLDTFLILQAGLPYKLRNELKIGKSVRIFEWAAFEYNLVPNLSRIGAVRRLQEKSSVIYNLLRVFDYKKNIILSKWTEELISRGAIAFMTEIIFKTTQKYLGGSQNVKPVYLPNLGTGNSLYNAERLKGKSQEVKQCMEIAWLGRIADFKISILNYSIKKIKQIATNEGLRINFHIIGDGEYGNSIEFDGDNEFFCLKNIGSLSKADVDLYLEKNIHCLFAMGTSALDGARLGLPVVLLDYSYSKIVGDYNFRYLQHATGFDLGHPITAIDFVPDNVSLKNMIFEMKYHYLIKSNEVLEYYMKNHSVEKITAKLIELIKNNHYYYTEIPADLKSLSVIRRLYLLYLKKFQKRYYKV
ncbi:MAG: hypothetical protein P0Y49_00695 [Candidatus Pedobacter colombiensis]|uniref:Glycosyltransferase n=1 Tax=Candidatus Pedobacter colombiensis TaxID=3121371 RepID=A0AAJ5W6Y3_9SPHI|nr:hypothetical protein [Pedobacter sp.]WEK19673.1 MAG: hypothetical protein P0Y49_00695 [Pedobacter sp.]